MSKIEAAGREPPSSPTGGIVMQRTSLQFRSVDFRYKGFVWLTLIVFCLSFVPSSSLAQQPTATINTLNGTALVNGQAANAGMILNAGDVIETQSGASVILELSDGSQLEVGENTRLDLAELSQTASGARVSRVKLVWGWLRARLSPGHQAGGSAFDIETPNALIGVKFSQPDVEVSYDLEKHETVGLARTMALSAKNLMTNEEIIVPVGSTVIITDTTIKIIAGLVSLEKADEAAKAEAEAAKAGADAAATGATGAGTAATIGGMSPKTLALVGLGVVAVGGGVAIVASDGGGNGGSDSGVNDPFTGTFVAQNVGGWSGTLTFELLQNGTSISGSYNEEYGVYERYTFSVTGTVSGSSASVTRAANGLSANLRCYDGQGYDDEMGYWYPLSYELFFTATLINDGNILQVTEEYEEGDIGETIDFIRQ